MTLPATMQEARMHQVGGPLLLETVEMPVLADTDVLVRIRACGIVPNLINVMRYYPTLAPQLPLDFPEGRSLRCWRTPASL